MLCRPTHPTANRSPAPYPGPGPQKEAVERRPRRCQLPGTLPTPPPNPGAPQPTGHLHPRMAHHGHARVWGQVTGPENQLKTGTNVPPPDPNHPAPQTQTPAPLPSPPPAVATDPQQKGPSHKHPSGQECGPTPNKGADQPARHNQNTPHKGGHIQPPPNPQGRANRAPSPRSPAPDSSHNQASRATKHIPLQHQGRHQTAPDPKWQAHPKCKLQAMIGTCTPPPITGKPRPPDQLGSQADATMHHPAHYHAQGKDTGPASRRAPQKGPSTRSKEVTPPSRDADPPTSRGTARTTNPKHTEPTRNHPANEQTPPQYEAETPDASTEPSDTRPAAPRPEVRAAAHRTTTPTPQHAIQWRTECSKGHPKQKLHTKPTLRKCAPTSPPKTKPPMKVHPHEKKTRTIQVLEHARHPYPCQKQPRKATLRGPQKAREPTEPKPKPIRKPRPIHPETNPGQPAHSDHADPSEPPPPDRKGTSVSNRNQDKEPETEPEPPKTKQHLPTSEGNPHPPQHSNNSQST
ncbi:proteoglycan 4-like [Girardinichthys multiradiatus]|uniref:proteoglycan 4-like n=1 Tax=Girardinichthys multiradiatus TaxID=208333 RepID=UPI001FAC71C5|nr:proteoglycan 4-like [Girardinichthys multiradiatus]